MPSKARTRIPRSSPSKSSVKPTTTAPLPSAPHHNSPILLRGTGKSASILDPPSTAASSTGTLPLGLSPLPSPPNGTSPSNNVTAQQVQRTNGSRIPSPLKSRSRMGMELGTPLPTSTSASGFNAATPQTPHARTGRPSFHVPVIHSPALNFVSTTPSEPLDPGVDIQADSSGPIGSNVKPLVMGKGEPQQDVVSATPPNLMRKSTAASDMSSESQYTTQSARESAEGHDTAELRDGDKIVDDKHTADAESNGGDCESENAVLSPGFDVIQALANRDKFQVVDHGTPYTPYEQSQKTPRPLPVSCDTPVIMQSIRAPPSPLASIVTRETKAHRRSLVAEAADMMSRNPLTALALHSPNAPTSQRTKSRALPSRPYISGSISDIIDHVETLIGHPCVNRDAVHTAHREAAARHTTASSGGAVFGASLNATSRYASCSSVLGGQTHILPLVVFACVEELYRAGLRSSRLLRPPPHAPATPSITVARSLAPAHSATHSFPALVAAFNTPPTYGDDIDLALASIDDVGALLLTYLDCLPGGIVPVWVRSVLGDAVGIYEEANGDDEVDRAREQQRAICAAQLVLRLLPPAQFSLLVYLLAFLSQIPLYEARNGWNLRGVARAFARVVVGVGVGDMKGKRKDNSVANEKHHTAHGEDEVDWVAEEEDAVEVLEWLLAIWDDLSDGLFSDPLREGHGWSGGEGDGMGDREMHRAAAMRHLDPTPNTRSEDGTTTVLSNPVGSNPSATPLLARIAFLERENAEWQWLQVEHKVELQLMFQAGEQKIAEVEEALRKEREARAIAEDALIKERDVLRNVQTRTEDEVRAERALWVGEMQALREAWESLGKASEGVKRGRDAVGNIVGRIAVGRK